jgi:eukaryotic translation initiation factor 2-alpha kinase 4
VKHCNQSRKVACKVKAFTERRTYLNNERSSIIFSSMVLFQVPFARYVARSGVTQLKRYSVENVYRENRLLGLHPRELAACAFDIVSPSNCMSLIPDAEVIAIVSEVVSEMEPHSDCHGYKIRINHTALVRAVLLHCGIAEAFHAEVYAILGNSKVIKLVHSSSSSVE